MQEQALIVFVVAVCLIAVHGNQRELRDELNALPQHIGYGSIIGIGVIGIEGQHTAGKGIHHILARRLHNNISDKVCRKVSIACEQLREISKLLLIRQLAKQ